MRVLFVAMQWDYGEVGRGPSFETLNLWDALTRMHGVEAHLFPFDEEMSRHGRDGMNSRLIARADELDPQVVFFFLFEDEFDPATLERVGRSRVTVNWFADDHWRFWSYSRHWARHFAWVTTTDPASLEAYRGIGQENVILTQWGFNPHAYMAGVQGHDVEVSFVGQAHGSRPRTIARLRSRGISVLTRGYGWPDGRVTHEEMLEMFQRSKINLNLSGSSRRRSLKALAGLLFKPDRGARRFDPLGAPSRVAEQRRKKRPQIKARVFEVTGCGAFLLTEEVPHLDRYLQPGRELVTFDSEDDLVEKCRYYLAHEQEREAIARAGRERVLNEHTYQKRFQEIFRQMGLLE